VRPGIRMIREELRREAERVPIPEDMWQRISAELEQDLRRQQRRRRILQRLRALRPLLALTLVGGVLGAVLWSWSADTTWYVPPASGGRDVAFLRPPKDNLRAGYFVAVAGWQRPAQKQEGRGSPSARVAP